MSLRLHVDRIHFDLTLSSLRADFRVTSIYLRSHFDVTSISLRFRLEITFDSLRIHLDFTSISLLSHFGSILISLRFHFIFLRSYFVHINSSSILLRSTKDKENSADAQGEKESLERHEGKGKWSTPNL